MGLFMAKKKDVDTYETEMSLPSFGIDANGFVIFDNPQLGGAAILEVTPRVRTEAITHEDPIYKYESTDFSENPSYEPTINTLFGDARRETYAAWTYFLNELHAKDDGDEALHVQILAKKCISDEWTTRTDYALHNARKEFASALSSRPRRGSSANPLMDARKQDYVAYLEAMKDEIDNSELLTMDVRAFSTYIVKYFIIVSYTPSSEGWWLDGRDTDYYITDNSLGGAIFQGNNQKLVDKLTDILDSRRKRKADLDIYGGQEDDFFWIRSDRTAQILSTRVHKILRTMDSWNSTHDEDEEMPFALRMVDGREAAALICFFPNIVTPYWDRIWSLQSNQNEVLYGMNVQKAFDTNDSSIVLDHDLANAIADGKVDVRRTQQEQDEFLSRYKGVDFKEIGDIHKEHDDALWSIEREVELEEHKRKIEEQRASSLGLWDDIDDGSFIDDRLKTPEQRREDYLKRYTNRR